jgi:hypothetical protein
VNPTIACAALLLLALLASPAGAVPVTLTERSPDAAYAIWVTTSLDLTEPGQPVARVDLPADSDTVDVPLPGPGPHWLFLHERFQPRGGPPLDLLLPHTLIPDDRADAPITFGSVDPGVLMTRERFSTDPSVLKRLALVILLVFGGGFGLRAALRGSGALPGRRCAPLAGAELPPAGARHTRIFWGAVAALVALRMPGFFHESLDLLEVSYLPGIGRPAPFAEGVSGLAGAGAMVRELLALYCLDLTHPPLYHAVLGVMGLLGRAEWLLRVPALATSVVSAWLLWQLGRRWSEAAGLVSVGLFAVAAPAIYFGQDATPYAFVGTVAVGATWALLRALESGRRGWWRLFFGLLVAGFLCHYNVAPFGMALVLLLVGWVALHRDSREWRAALHLGLGAALELAALPVLWTWLHFSTFPTVAQDTRLVADTYMADPGWFSFLVDFTKVTSGIRADGPTWALLGALPLLGLGLASAWTAAPGDAAARNRRLLSQVMLVLGATFVLSTLFFYDNARTHLGGRVFFGFRWVGWYHPVLLCGAALGLVSARVPLPARLALLAIWGAGALPATGRHLTEPARPDYAGAAELFLAEAKDGDAIATLPAWFQRGNLAYYLFESGRVRRLAEMGEGAWSIEGRRVTFEAVHAGLPFETTARNTHVDRLWVGLVRETMFGRDKFDPRVSAQAVAWADEHMDFQQEWVLDRLVLRLYARKPGDLDAPVEPVRLDAGDVPLMSRTYPPLDGPLVFERPGSMERLERLGPTLAYQAPMTPVCVDYEVMGLPDGLRPEAGLHWYFDLRVPGPQPRIDTVGSGKVTRQPAPGGSRVLAVGPPCDSPPLRLDLRQP